MVQVQAVNEAKKAVSYMQIAIQLMEKCIEKKGWSCYCEDEFRDFAYWLSVEMHEYFRPCDTCNEISWEAVQRGLEKLKKCVDEVLAN